MKSIFDGTNDAWAVSSLGKNLGLMEISSGADFIAISEQDGWRHAFLYSRDGDERAVPTKGAYDIIERGPVDGEGSGDLGLEWRRLLARYVTENLPRGPRSLRSRVTVALAALPPFLDPSRILLEIS